MALVVEDGTGKSNSDSFISQSDADTYFTNHDAPTAWTCLASAKKDAALRYAATTLDGNWIWDGTITVTTQALGWPRTGVEDDEGRDIASAAIPERVKTAQCELALLHTSSALNSNYDRGNAIRREKVGPIETEYFESATMEARLPIIDRIVHGLGSRRARVMGEISRA